MPVSVQEPSPTTRASQHQHEQPKLAMVHGAAPRLMPAGTKDQPSRHDEVHACLVCDSDLPPNQPRPPPAANMCMCYL